METRPAQGSVFIDQKWNLLARTCMMNIHIATWAGTQTLKVPTGLALLFIFYSTLKIDTFMFNIFPAHLHSKDEFIREESGLCIENLSRQCSDWMGIKEMIERLFAVLNGNL